jgi:peroxiredoxin
MENRKWLSIALGLIGAVVCATVCIFAGLIGGSVLVANQSVPGNTLKAGTTAPDFELTTLDGDTVTLSQFRGSPVLLDIGASWCPDCQLAAPKLQALHEAHHELVVLSVDSKEDAGTVQAYADENGLTYPIALDSTGSVAEMYQIYAIPTLFFIDGDGVIQEVIVETYSDDHVTESLAEIGITP